MHHKTSVSIQYTENWGSGTPLKTKTVYWKTRPQNVTNMLLNNQKLEHLNDINFRELFDRIRFVSSLDKVFVSEIVSLLYLPILPITSYGVKKN